MTTVDPITTQDYYQLAASLSGVHYGDRDLAGASQRAERRAAREAIESRRAMLLAELAVVEAELDPAGGQGPNPVRNEVRFPAIAARFVRLSIQATSDGGEPGIDELEVFGPTGDTNLALASTPALATASSLLPGYAIHQIAHLNDGATGNDHSWISHERGQGWVQIELSHAAPIERVVWSRDRQGVFRDRTASRYEVAVSDDANTWRQVFDSTAPRPDDKPAASARRAELAAERDRLVTARTKVDAELAALADFPLTWAALAQTPEAVHVLLRGDVRAPGELATPAGLSSMPHAAPAWGLPPNADDRARRAALARWITAPENPLTARVIVNRLWHYHFGQGLVDTPSDFGFQGGRPSHPELLDWLAAELVAQHYSLRAIHRLILHSACYRQSVADQPAAAERDPGNRWLWRANRRRLDAESLRDAILATAGTLDRTAGGPSFRLFEYTDGNIPVFAPRDDVQPATWRRSLYRHAVRSHSTPLLDQWDCPDCSVMAPARSRTTTPLQTLSLWNNRFVLLQAERFAERVRRETGNSTESGSPVPEDVVLARQVARAWELVYSRPPTTEERALAGTVVAEHGLAALARALWNSNEFLYIE